MITYKKQHYIILAVHRVKDIEYAISDLFLMIGTTDCVHYIL